MTNAIPVFRAADQALASADAVQGRRDRCREPHVAPLQALAERISANHDAPEGVPRFDPLDGGINARVLLLQEAPGPRAVGTGFVSFDKSDQTTANARHACESAGLSRRDVVRWNAVPWYIGNEGRTKIRAANRLKSLPDAQGRVLRADCAGGSPYRSRAGNVKTLSALPLAQPHDRTRPTHSAFMSNLVAGA
ncbi:hypothetical protein QTI24_28640 [Variovorax sp. J22P240]|uniref:hypothetical protein n=1 Tax=Variovorax sp. J22P240 TaxID=3053514 RepID=UPI0025762F6E|nr:hypothetical protein [Variovorax sp. J22P240]MDM0002602.1 hypothetical protein [Variovorax sp. J22P240]